MKPIKVVVHGALGRMGQTLVNALCRQPDMQIVGAVDLKATDDSLSLPDGSGRVPLSSKLELILTAVQPEVMVDFTTAEAVMPAVRTAAEHGVNLVIGTTGLTAENIKAIESLAKAHKIGAVVAPNFALGAVLMMHLAKLAGKHLDYAEIIELHHERKVDAPSGTALSTARAMAQARGRPFSTPPAGKKLASRGEAVEGISIHSVRLPGLMAHQEVMLGGEGQTLSIRHDQISREAFMPGVLLAVREAAKQKGLTYGLESLLGLEKK
ncbi:MAG TPA: 4-hydroxy-tetrahydrodipicolinate reductase [Dehalococcoidia bacterium]|nr:4-hydroxy-tetrahydrodipicolinate reductase [Dehalococcoidia bacterium]